MEDPKYINPVGYSEMYEWNEVPLKSPFGRFVQFSKQNPDKIEYFDWTGPLLGISTIQSIITSDDPTEWRYAYLCSEVGDRYLSEENIAVGIKQYDQNLELAYISTQPYKYYKTVPSKGYDENQKYTKRSNRKEWVRVNLLGKVILEDDGTCQPGGFCQPISAEFHADAGKATAWIDSPYKYYVLRRIAKNTIEVLNSQIYFGR